MSYSARQVNEWTKAWINEMWFLSTQICYLTKLMQFNFWCSISQQCIHKHFWQGFKTGKWQAFYFRYPLSFLNSNWSTHIHWSVSFHLQIRTLSSAAVICSLLTMNCDRFSYWTILYNKDAFRDIPLNSQHVMNCSSFSQSATVVYSNTLFPSSLFILLNMYLGLHKTVCSTVLVLAHFICCFFND